MAGWALKDRVALAGVGVSRFERRTARSNLALAAEALRNALEDAGLRKDDVDGLLTNVGWPLGVDYDRLAEAFGLDLRFADQTWTHGRFVGPTLQHAVLAVAGGLATCVACLAAVCFSRLGTMGGPMDVEGERQGGGSHGETPHYGMTAPGAGAAMSMRIYLHRYGGRPEDLAAVPIALRRHARLNPNAVMQKPMDLAAYLAEPYIVEPLRRADFAVMSDGAACVLVTAAERARDLRQAPVLVKGMQGLRAGREEFIFARPGLGAWQQRLPEFRGEEHAAYRVAEVTPADIDGLYVYDAFSPNVLFALERFGVVPPGEALAWVQGGRIELGGDLPVNTNGGLLSEAHATGWNHIVEIVRQLRGQCGERQVRDAEIMQWATPFGDALAFGR
ncbi:MAG: thiolase family protein [Chloroflexi bacterium]|nr:thiolase family protein [Chloroflexota bacterium]